MTFEILSLVKVMITQLVVYQIIPISKIYYKIIARDLSKQQKLDADPKAIQQFNFTRTLDRDGNTKISFITEEVKERFFKWNS